MQALRGLLLFACVMAAMPGGLVSANAQPSTELLAAELVQDPGRERIVLTLSAPVALDLQAAEAPLSITLDMAADIAGEARIDLAAHSQTIADARLAPSANGIALVLDLAAPAQVTQLAYLPAIPGRDRRLVLTLVPVNAETFGSWAAAGAVPGPVSSFVAEPATRERPLVVIDPGHGGVDPGATGPAGLYEKTIVLSVGIHLRDVLLETGAVDVVMTRDSDVYVRLLDRVALARQHGADLLVSLHADTVPESYVRGASVYVVSEVSSDQQAALLASRENEADRIAGVPVPSSEDPLFDVLLGLARERTLAESETAAGFILEAMGEVMGLVNNARRHASFVVLKAPDVPSVLVELGYLSNPEEARFLADPANHEAVARALAAGIVDYFAWRD
ncbi:MAG: N-acetylmuramoyl-L-alanine amidase [Azospirillaceae bacterium]